MNARMECRRVMMKEKYLELGMQALKLQVSGERILRRHSGTLFMIFGAVLLMHGLEESVLAQTGEGIFDTAACTLGQEVLTKEYGAMLSAIAGLLAIMASVMGAFKAAWSLVFVTVGTFTFPQIVSELFTIKEECGGG